MALTQNSGGILDWRYIINKLSVSPGDSGYPTLDDILADPPAGKYIETSTPQTLDAAVNRTIPAGYLFAPKPGGITTIPNGRRLTFASGSSLIAGQYPIFAFEGTGEVVFERGVLENFWLRWFNTTGLGVAEDTVAFQKAINSIKNLNSGNLYGSQSDIYLIDTITLGASNPYSNWSFNLIGNGATIKQSSALNDPIVIDVWYDGWFKQWRIIGNTIANRTGNGIKVYHTSWNKIDDVVIRYFEKPILYQYSSFTGGSNIRGNYCKYGLCCEQVAIGEATVGSNAARFTNLLMENIDEIPLMAIGTQVLTIDGFGIENCGKNAGYFENVGSLKLTGIYGEGIGGDNDPAFPHVWHFKDVTNLDLHQDKLGLDGTAFTDLFYFDYVDNPCSGSIRGMAIPVTNPPGGFLRGYDFNDVRAVGAMSIEGNDFTGPNKIIPCGNYTPGMVEWKNNVHSSGLVLPQGMTTKVSTVGPYREYCTSNWNFAEAITPNAISDGTTQAIEDTIVFVPGVNSWKITWGGANSYVDTNVGFFSGVPAVRAWGVFSTWVRASEDMEIDFWVHGFFDGPGKGIKISGDGDWRLVQVMGTTTNPTSTDYLKVKSDNSGGILYVTLPSLKAFLTSQEAMSWMGKWEAR